MVAELDLDGAVVVEFGRASAIDIVTFVKTGPGKDDNGPKQHLRRNRWPTCRRIQLREVTLQFGQRRIRYLPDQPQRMIRPNPVRQIDIGKQLARSLVCSAHLTLG